MRECPWERDTLLEKKISSEIPPQGIKIWPADPLSLLQRLTEALIELRLKQAKEGDSQGWLNLCLGPRPHPDVGFLLDKTADPIGRWAHGRVS